jgi:hypothetical protein
MTEFSFTEEDKQKVIEFLNLVADKATFQLKTDEVIKHFRLLAHMQQSILPKISANILEVVRVHEAPKPEDAKPEAKPEAPKEAKAAKSRG